MVRRPRHIVLASVSFVLVSVGVFAQGCGLEDHVFGECMPDPVFPSPQCPGDAGTDGSDGGDGGGGTSAKSDCSGRCVPIPDDPDVGAGFWSKIPLQVWVGPAADLPTQCPYPHGAKQFALFDGLNAPPALCDTCDCKLIPGQCEGIPSDLSIRAGSCGDVNASSLPFDGPPGWDGSCTNADALPAGAECPPGSGIPCVQSVSFSALPPPTGESCEVVSTPVPTVTTRITSWDTAALACATNEDPYTCNEGAGHCVPDVLFPWRQCIWRPGVHDKCPDNYAYELPRVMFPELPAESRKCTDCACGGPEGGTCVGTVRLFEDSACTSQFHQQTVASVGGDCSPIFPAGKAVGSKAITDRLYMPGSCKASGGEPIGEAHPDAAGAVTFCCLRSYVFSG